MSLKMRSFLLAEDCQVLEADTPTALVEKELKSREKRIEKLRH